MLAGRMKFDIRNISGSLRFESDEGQVGLRDKGALRDKWRVRIKGIVEM